MATNFSPCKGSYVLNQFPSNVMFGMNGFHVSASGAIQGHHGPLVIVKDMLIVASLVALFIIIMMELCLLHQNVFITPDVFNTPQCVHSARNVFIDHYQNCYSI